MGLLNREALLKKEVLKIEKVEFDDGDHIFVTQMTGRERDRFEQSIMKETDVKGELAVSMEDFRAKLVVNTICDEEGNNLLEPGDWEVLSQHMSAARLELIVNVSQKLNHITQKDKEAMVKNSESVLSEDSTSDSAKS